MESKIITIILQRFVGVHNITWGKKYTQKGLIKILSVEVLEMEELIFSKIIGEGDGGSVQKILCGSLAMFCTPIHCIRI
jgi:hypothetical protein